MTKELIAVLALGLTLVSAIFAGGVRLGTLTERVSMQTKQIDKLTSTVEALSVDFNGTRLEIMQLMSSHIDPRRTR